MKFLEKIYSAGLDNSNDGNLNQKITLSNRVALMVIVLAVIYLPISFVYFPYIWICPLAAILLNMFAIVMNSSGMNQQGRFLVSVATPSLVFIFHCYLIDNVSQFLPSFYFTLIATCLVAWLLFDLEEKGWLYSSVFYGIILILSQPFCLGFFNMDYDHSILREPWVVVVNYSLGTLLFFGCLQMYSLIRVDYIKNNKKLIREVQEQNEEIYAQNEELIQQQSHIKESQDELTKRKDELFKKSVELENNIEMANSIQKVILEENTKLDEMPVDYFIFQEAKEKISGDFLWIKSEEDISLIVSGETNVTDLSGAILNSFIVNEIKTRVYELESLNVLELYKDITLFVKEKLKGTFVYEDVIEHFSVNVVKIDFKKGILSYISSDGFVAFFDGDKLTYAESSNDTLKRVEVNIKKGDRVLVFSDGFWKQKNKKGEAIGIAKFKSLLETHIEEENIDDIQAKIRAGLRSWQGYENLTDDVLVFGLEVF